MKWRVLSAGVMVLLFIVVGLSAAEMGNQRAYLPLIQEQDGITTSTPTPTVTPTVTPVPFPYFQDLDPNLPIPDGPQGVIIGTISVSDSILIRELRFFVNIEHDEAGDLEITAIHPNGTRLLLKAQGEDAGTVNIRRWFPVTGTALEEIRNTNAQGTWFLEVQDQVEGLTGEFLAWSMEIYP